MLDARLLHFRLLPRLRRMLVEFIPLVLPVVHGLFSLLQALADTVFKLLQLLQLGRRAWISSPS